MFYHGRCNQCQNALAGLSVNKGTGNIVNKNRIQQLVRDAGTVYVIVRLFYYFIFINQIFICHAAKCQWRHKYE